MKIEDQVCSLEIANRLKELGVKQKSIFYWHNLNDTYFVAQTDIGEDLKSIKEKIVSSDYKDDRFLVSAFTVAELGEMLPKRLKHHWKVGSMYKFKKGTYVDLRISCNERTKEWIVNYYGDTGFDSEIKDIYFYGEIADTEANARGKMLIYLLENNLISPNDMK